MHFYIYYKYYNCLLFIFRIFLGARHPKQSSAELLHTEDMKSTVQSQSNHTKQIMRNGIVI